MKKILITGGAGFIGVNAAAYFSKLGDNVVILDNLSRKGSEKNISWLLKEYPKTLFKKTDIRDFDELKKIINEVDVIIHLAGQVAVTTSISNPKEDFEINTVGTINVLEAIRLSSHSPIVLYSSTNKVYGALDQIPVIEDDTRYRFKHLQNGVDESHSLDFHSPYGCSKGAADQYVRDYSRIYGLKTVVFRQSCIFGPHQFGMEDQGWVAWFLILPLLDKKINIYGDGKQVRDLLFVEDLIRGYELAIKNINKTRGEVYNIGGGMKNTLSIWWEFKPILENIFKKEIEANFLDPRAGDQKIFVSDSAKAKRDFGWEPKVRVEEGIKRFYEWMMENKRLVLERFK